MESNHFFWMDKWNDGPKKWDGGSICFSSYMVSLLSMLFVADFLLGCSLSWSYEAVSHSHDTKRPLVPF